MSNLRDPAEQASAKSFRAEEHAHRFAPVGVVDRTAHYDTVVILVDWRITHSDLWRGKPVMGQLREMMPPEPDRGGLLRDRVQQFDTAAWGWGARLRLQRPPREALSLVRAARPGNRAMVQICHPAEEIVTATRADAFINLDKLAPVIVQKWHGKRQMTEFEDSVYGSDDKWTSRNFDLYVGKSKTLPGYYATRIEFRFGGAPACRAAGLGTIDDLLDADLCAIIERELTLKAIDAAKADKTIRRRAGDLAREVRRQLDSRLRRGRPLFDFDYRRPTDRETMAVQLAAIIWAASSPDRDDGPWSQLFHQVAPLWLRVALVDLPTKDFLPIRHVWPTPAPLS